MNIPKTSSTDGINVLIGIFLNHTVYVKVVEDISTIICELIYKHKDSLIKIKSDGSVNFNLPYDKIANEIYNHKKFIDFESLDSFVSTVYSYIEAKETHQILAHSIKSKEYDQILVCYRKFTRHILLALRQRNFIFEVTKEAQRIATEAAETAKEVQKLAKQTKKEIQTSMVNFVTILGIFATIIFALFGGVNLVSAVNNLLASAHRPRLAVILFLMSILVITITTFLILLMTWLNEMKGLEHKELKPKIYLKIYYGVLTVCSLLILATSIKLL